MGSAGTRPTFFLLLHRLPGVGASCCHRHIDICWMASKGAYSHLLPELTLQILDPEITVWTRELQMGVGEGGWWEEYWRDGGWGWEVRCQTVNPS